MGTNLELCIAQDTTLNINDIRKLGIEFGKKGIYQLSYFYNFSYYLLSKDSTERVNAAIDAIDACLLSNHYNEAEQIIFSLENYSSDLTDVIKLKYGYSLVMQKQFTRGKIYLDKIQNKELFKDQFYFLKAYSEINTNQVPECISSLKQISNTFINYKGVEDIQSDIQGDRKIRQKHLAVALPLSVLVPGLGQAYSGFYFDAIQSFSLNAAFGMGAYSSWKYEMTKEKADRNYVLPSLTTLVFSVFYITNLYNTINVTQKSNLYSRNIFYKKIIDKFDIILENNQYFVRLKVKL